MRHLILRLIVATAAVGPHVEVRAAEPPAPWGFDWDMLSRRIEVLESGAYFEGHAAYHNRKTRRRPRFEYTEPRAGRLSQNRRAFELEEWDSYPVVSESILVRVKWVNGRMLNVNYRGPDSLTPIKFCVEEPFAYQLDLMGKLGEGVWFGYLLAPDLPALPGLSEQVTWTRQPDGGVAGVYGDFRIVVEYNSEGARRPRVVTISPTGKDAEARLIAARRPDFWRILNREIELSAWADFGGVECPGRIEIWNACLDLQGKKMSCNMTWDLKSVGPREEMTDRYGDYFTDIPGGTPVQVNDYPGIDFIWSGGEIVRKVDHVKLKSLLGKPFFGSPFRRYMYVGLGVLALGVVGWLVWRRREKA